MWWLGRRGFGIRCGECRQVLDGGSCGVVAVSNGEVVETSQRLWQVSDGGGSGHGYDCGGDGDCKEVWVVV